MQKLKSFAAFLSIIGMLFLNISPVFAIGELPPVEPPPAPVVDVCPNIDGAQTSIPTGMIVNGSGNCITPIPADTTAPVISSVASLSLATTEATIVWTTDELAVSHFEYGTTTSYGTQPTLDATALLVHTAILTGLTANTTYHYCIHATDLSNNTANSCGHSFTTAANPIIIDSTPPDITLITVVPITTTSATIGFTTSEIANAEVEYGTTAGYGSITPLDTNLALTHSVTILNLTPNTSYHYRIKTSDEIGNQTVSPDETFTTEATSGGNVQILDITAPVVSEAGAISFGTTTVTLGWTTNELSTSTLEYGTSTNYGTPGTLSASALLAHTASLTGLTAGTIYYYCIHSTDIAGNVANSCGHSFITELASAPADTTAPVISAVASRSEQSGAIIIWTTNELSNSQVEYGATTSYGSITTPDPILALTHTANITGLSMNATYHYRVKSIDDSGNIALSPDQTITFTPPISDPFIQAQTSTLNISAIETTSITTSSVTINWQTDFLSDSQVEYGNSENLGTLTAFDTTMTTHHSVTLSGLSQNTNYIFKVKSKPIGASVQTVSANQEFDTLSQSIPIVSPANILSVSSSSITTTAASITWTTDKNTTSQVEYGISTSYGASTILNQTMQISHVASLSNLESSTTYHYRAKSVDSASNITYSEDYTFTTSANSSGTVSAPSAITTLAIGGYDNSSVALVWNASSADADIAARYDIRYYTIPINDSNFTSAIPAQTTPILYVDLDPSGTQRDFIIAGLDSDTPYYFAIKSHFQTSEYSQISNVVSVRTTKGRSISNETTATSSSDGGSGGGRGFVHVKSEYGTLSGGTSAGSFEPTLVKAEPADNQIIFTWNNPGESNFVRTVVVRKEGSYPTGPADGQTVYEGKAQTFTDTNVQNDKTYFYTIYSYNHNKTYSSGINISLAPSVTNKEVKFNESGVEASVTSIEHFTKVYKKGDKDIEIEHLQEILSADGDSYAEKYISGYFGTLTEKALKSFQVKHGLAQTGIVDVATQKELNTIASSENRLEIPEDYLVFGNDMKLGDQNENVHALQHYLIYEGSLSNKNNNGVFGKSTKVAVMAFQKKYGIDPVSGYVGYKTRHKMQQLTGL